MVVVVVNTVLVAGHRARGLDPADQALACQRPEGVVNRLAGDSAYLRPYQLTDLFGASVGPRAYGPQDRHALRRYLQAALA
jgi:hypothetical protein